MDSKAANPVEVHGHFLNGKRLIILFVSVIMVGLAAWVVIGQRNARSNLRQAKEALDNDQPEIAHDILGAYLQASPSSAEGLFLAAQAARRCRDFAAAERLLEESKRNGWDASAIDLERAMISAQTGNLRSVEATLLQAVNEKHSESPQVIAVLVPSLMMEFRWLEALALAEKWTDLRPNSAKAWALRGEILERLRRRSQAADALREAVRLDANDQKSRFALARLILEIRQSPDEAAEHLRWLRDVDPNKVAVEVQFAVCREAQGFPEEAARILDRLIAAHPGEANSYYHRGRLELARGNAKAALPLLRRSSDLNPSDPEVLYSLLLALREVGTAAEVREAQERLEQCNADLKRVAELARAISASPRDPDLRREMGELFLKNGREQEGISWLKSALRERIDHRPTHLLLAEHYDRAGDQNLAAYHRKFVGP